MSIQHMEQQHANCALLFPHQGVNDGHTFVLRKSRPFENYSFHVGEGYKGEVNKLSGDGLVLEDQLKLIHQFCKNQSLTHLRIDIQRPSLVWPSETRDIEYGDRALLFWTTLMRELQGSTSLKYIEFLYFPNFFKEGEDYMKTMVEMFSENSSLLGLKIWFLEITERDLIPFIQAVSINSTLQSLHLAFRGRFFEMKPLKLLMESLTPNSTGCQSNTTLRALVIADTPSSFLTVLSAEISDEGIVTLLLEAFLNMLETNKTLTTIQIPGFVSGLKDIMKVLDALEVNQSISNIILHPERASRFFALDEFYSEEVFSRLLRLIKFRNDHGNNLTMVDVQGTTLENPKFNVHIQGALKKKYSTDGGHGEFFVRPLSCRVFLCGFPEAGKTTLRKKMKYILREKSKKFHLLYSISKRVERTSTHVSKRTTGVEVVTNQAGVVELSFWDMGGQDEYHAYHDLIVPNLSDKGSASLFILVCSMTTIKEGTNYSIEKSTKAIERELQYWLRFLSSNTKTSRIFKLHVLLVFTHKDVFPKSIDVGGHVEDLVTSVKKKFGDSFQFSSMEYFVNSNSTQMVEPFVESMLKEVETILSKVPSIFAACLEMRHEITKWKGDHPCQTMMKWEDFVFLCRELPRLKRIIPHLDANLVEDFCKTIAASLNEGGYIIYIEDLDVIVTDPNWFGTRIIGSIFSIDYKCLDPHTMEPLTNEKGYIERDKLKRVLENSLKDRKGAIEKGVITTHHMDVEDLIKVMKEMNICFEEHSTPNTQKLKKLIFIPATLRDEGGLAHQGRRKLKWNIIGSSPTESMTYVGRRLQCEDLERTFLTPGFFPRLQVVLERKFGSKPTFRLEKNMVAFTEDGMQVLVEHSGDLTSGNFVDAFIDIMVQSLKNFEVTLQFTKQEVMKPIQRLCASQTFGCQGVTLLQSILRPKCVEHLWLCIDRRDQAINERELIENVLSKEDFEGYYHHWPDHEGETARKLLGDVVWNKEIVNRRRADLAKLANDLMQEQGQELVPSMMEEIGSIEDFQVSSLEDLYKKLAKDLGQVGDNIVKRVNEHTDKTICGMQRKVLEEVYKSMNRLIDHSVQLLQRQVPCYVYVTTEDLGTSEWLISSLVPGLQSVKLHLMCEHKGDIHTVEDQEGVVLHLESKTLQGLRPYVIWGLRIITMLMKMSLNVTAGLGSFVPELERSLSKGFASIIPNISSNLLGPEGTPVEQVNLMKLKNYINNSEKKIAEQWLVKFLDGKNLQEDFGLQRVRYKDGSNDIAWVCQRHIDEGCSTKVLELCPI